MRLLIPYEKRIVASEGDVHKNVPMRHQENTAVAVELRAPV